VWPIYVLRGHRSSAPLILDKHPLLFFLQIGLESEPKPKEMNAPSYHWDLSVAASRMKMRENNENGKKLLKMVI